jgi:hypothetical protein
MDATEELKITYKFEWEKKIAALGVEIDPLGGSVVGDLKKLKF